MRIWQDFHFALRQLKRNPGFALTAVAILALGIGATTAIFSAVNPILFQPLPYPQSSRLAAVWDVYQGARSDVTFHTYREIAERNRAFDALAVFEPWQPTLVGADQPERLEGQSVSAQYFRALGVAPAMGRDFQESEARFHGPKVTLLSYALWQRRFGGDPGIVGQPVMLDGDQYSVIGVMPHGFENVLAPAAELWSPMQYDSSHITDLDTAEWGHHLQMVARMKADVTIAKARRDLDDIAHHPVADFPRAAWAAMSNGFILDALQDDVTRSVKPALVAVCGAVVLVLLIACVNVTNILLARGAQRRGEFAVRAALGAARGQLTRQLVTESLLLALIGGAAGMFVADFGVRALVALSPAGLPRVSAIALDHTVFAFALGVTTLIGSIVGLFPALQVSRADLHTSVRESSQRAVGGQQWTRRTLVVTEVALALVLLVSAGLLLHSLQRLFAVDPGFDPAQLLTMQVQTSGHLYEGRSAERIRFFEQSLAAVRAVPGVESAAFTSLLPLSGERNGDYGTHFEDRSSFDVFRYATSPRYLETMRIPLRRGRLLNDQDTASAMPVVVISESLARRAFGDRDPVGRLVHVGPLNRPWYHIVGVVGDVKQASLAEGRPEAVYLTSEQSWFADDAMSLVVRSRGNAAALTPSVMRAVWSIDKDQAIVRVATAADLLAATGSQRRFAMILFQTFAFVALVLAATGIYGVLSRSVTERVREIGVRVAVGATRGNILALVIRQGMALTGLGIAIGLVGAALASEALITLLFGVSRLDPLTYLGVIALLGAVSAVACGVPAWRAAKVDPATTLRSE